MSSVHLTDADVRAFVESLSPESRRRFFRVLDLLVDSGLRYFDEHPDEARAALASTGASEPALARSDETSADERP